MRDVLVQKHLNRIGARENGRIGITEFMRRILRFTMLLLMMLWKSGEYCTEKETGIKYCNQIVRYLLWCDTMRGILLLVGGKIWTRKN